MENNKNTRVITEKDIQNRLSSGICMWTSLWNDEVDIDDIDCNFDREEWLDIHGITREMLNSFKFCPFCGRKLVVDTSLEC